jgi:hypothetical protein
MNPGTIKNLTRKIRVYSRLSSEALANEDSSAVINLI